MNNSVCPIFMRKIWQRQDVIYIKRFLTSCIERQILVLTKFSWYFLIIGQFLRLVIWRLVFSRVELTGKYDLFFMDIKPCVWFIVRRRKIVELVVLHIGNFSPRWKIWGGKTKYGGLFLNFFHSTIFFSTYPHNLSLCTIFCTL